MNTNQPNIAAGVETDVLEAALYLLPVTLSDVAPSSSLPTLNLEIFCKIKHFVVENQRSARRFLKKVNKNINIDSLEMVELSEHTPDDAIPAMLQPVREGCPVGIMSEAGCPAVADPGARLVEAAHRNGIKVIPLVGPSSILLSLMGSGMNGQSFAFNGYLPIEDKERDNAIRHIGGVVSRTGATQIFIETPYRNNRLFERLKAVLPPTLRLCIATDLTGVEQSIVTMTVAEWKKSSFRCPKMPTIFLVGSAG